MANARAPHNQYSGMEFPDYEFQEFPKMLFSPTGETRLVNSVEEEEKLDSIWSPTPYANVLILNPEEQAAKKAMKEAADRALEQAIRRQVAQEMEQEDETKRVAELTAKIRAEMLGEKTKAEAKIVAPTSPEPALTKTK